MDRLSGQVKVKEKGVVTTSSPLPRKLVIHQGSSTVIRNNQENCTCVDTLVLNLMMNEHALDEMALSTKSVSKPSALGTGE